MAVRINTLNGGHIAVTLSSAIDPRKTKFTLQGGTVEEYDIVDTLNQQWMNDNGYWDGAAMPPEWIKTITEINIGNTVTSIGSATFISCHSLIGVTVPDSVTSIGGGAFYNCTNLTNVTLGNGITSIESGAFQECSSLEEITIDKSILDVQDMPYTTWGLGNNASGIGGFTVTIHCSDGDFTYTPNT